MSQVEYNLQKTQSSPLSIVFPQKVATLTNKRRSAAVSRETQEHTGNSQSENTFVRGITEEYITQVSEKIEDSVT